MDHFLGTVDSYRLFFTKNAIIDVCACNSITELFFFRCIVSFKSTTFISMIQASDVMCKIYKIKHIIEHNSLTLNPVRGHSIQKLPYVQTKIAPFKCSEKMVNFIPLAVHFNNEKQPLQCTNNFFLLGQLQGRLEKFWFILFSSRRAHIFLNRKDEFITCLLFMISFFNIMVQKKKSTSTLNTFF